MIVKFVIDLTTTWSVVFESKITVDSETFLIIIQVSPFVLYSRSDTIEISEVSRISPLINLVDGIVLMIAIF